MRNSFITPMDLFSTLRISGVQPSNNLIEGSGAKRLNLLTRQCMFQAATFVFVITVFFTLSSVAQTTNTQNATLRTCPDCPDLVSIKAGEFMMGLNAEDAKRLYDSLDGYILKMALHPAIKAETPQHKVIIHEPFKISRYPVTRQEFEKFVIATGYAPVPGCDVLGPRGYGHKLKADWRHPGFQQSDLDPVVCVNISDAYAYMGWLDAQSGRTQGSAGPHYKLPTEEQWEYVARAGTTTLRWWGDDIGVGEAVCYGCGSRYDNIRTAPVTEFRASEMGVVGILGNVMQWTSSCWTEGYNESPAPVAANPSAGCEIRAVRGGSFRAAEQFVVSASRSDFLMSDRNANVGFGLVYQ